MKNKLKCIITWAHVGGQMIRWLHKEVILKFTRVACDELNLEK